MRRVSIAEEDDFSGRCGGSVVTCPLLAEPVRWKRGIVDHRYARVGFGNLSRNARSCIFGVIVHDDYLEARVVGRESGEQASCDVALFVSCGDDYTDERKIIRRARAFVVERRGVQRSNRRKHGDEQPWSGGECADCCRVHTRKATMAGVHTPFCNERDLGMNSDRFGQIRPLGPGARVALIAPAGGLADPAQLEAACDNVRSLGWVPVTGGNVALVTGYLAGADAERVSDLNAALADDTIDAIWCVRGGYGAMRLLPDIDYKALFTNPRPLIGFSDITALHAAIHRECGIVSFHGPTARGELTEFSRKSLLQAVVDHADSCGVAPQGRTVRSGRAKGRLAGGNLALITALMGTPWSVDFEGAILVLEDVDEAAYRVDRMMRQLLLSGALKRCAGIVAGDFRAPDGENGNWNEVIDGVIGEAANEAGIPCLTGAPFGHIHDMWTIPLGATAELDADARTLTVD